jgi:hypothetical protein
LIWSYIGELPFSNSMRRSWADGPYIKKVSKRRETPRGRTNHSLELEYMLLLELWLPELPSHRTKYYRQNHTALLIQLV